MQQLLKNALSVATALTLGLASAPALADSTSSAASSASNSVGSSSASLGKSSDSASSSKKAVAQGHYTIIEMAAVDGQADSVRLRLQAVAALPTDGPVAAQTQAQAQTPAAAQPAAFDLVLPRAAAQRGQLAPGQTVAAEHRPYGLAFYAVTPAGQTEPFFLVLDDAWYRELASRPVGA